MLKGDEIDYLIACPKRAIKSDRKNMAEKNRSLRNNISLEPITITTNNYKFEMFLRQSTEFEEDFSVGLKLLLPNPTEHILVLMRCQGPHDTSNPVGFDRHHSYHIHKLSEEDIVSKRYDKPSRGEITDKFNNFVSAIAYFSDFCGIIDLNKVIDLPKFKDQMSLSF